MAIVSFWSNGKSETGKSSAIIALSTFLGVNHNYKILVLDTKMNDYFYHDCFWKEDKTIKKINNNNVKTDVGHGISGLSKAILSNKTSPEIVTNYTKLVFSNNRLEILSDTKIEEEDYEIHKKTFKDIAKIANRYYDLVFIDIDSNLDEDTTNSLLEISDLIVYNISQKIRNINCYLESKGQNSLLDGKAIMPLIGKFDKNSKYTAKNVSRYLKEKEIMCTIPYNTLFFEATNEGKVADYFIKFRKMNTKDDNSVFVEEVQKTADKIIYKLQELQMRI